MHRERVDRERNTASHPGYSRYSTACSCRPAPTTPARARDSHCVCPASASSPGGDCPHSTAILVLSIRPAFPAWRDRGIHVHLGPRVSISPENVADCALRQRRDIKFDQRQMRSIRRTKVYSQHQPGSGKRDTTECHCDEDILDNSPSRRWSSDAPSHEPLRCPVSVQIVTKKSASMIPSSPLLIDPACNTCIICNTANCIVRDAA